MLFKSIEELKKKSFKFGMKLQVILEKLEKQLSNLLRAEKLLKKNRDI